MGEGKNRNVISGGLDVIKKMGHKEVILVFVIFVLVMLAGCSADEDKSKQVKQIMAPQQVVQMDSSTAHQQSPPLPARNDAGEIAVEVNGIKMTKGELDKLVEKEISRMQSQIPAGQVEEARIQLRKKVIDDFVNLTLLKNEIAAKGITVGDSEISSVIDKMKAGMPQGKTFAELLRQHNIELSELREEIATNIKIEKLIAQEAAGDSKVTDKEIESFFHANKNLFTKPESVHARHILIATDKKDTQKSRADKRTRAEEIRKRLVAGEDFAELAAKSSDCPSKQNGGDLGTFTRGQMVKPFEDAAFSQAPNAIGPVVETDFGYHIIQVLEHNAPQAIKLNAETKRQIAEFLQQKKRQEAFEKLIKRLKAAADIVITG